MRLLCIRMPIAMCIVAGKIIENVITLVISKIRLCLFFAYLSLDVQMYIIMLEMNDDLLVLLQKIIAPLHLILSLAKER